MAQALHAMRVHALQAKQRDMLDHVTDMEEADQMKARVLPALARAFQV